MSDDTKERVLNFIEQVKQMGAEMFWNSVIHTIEARTKRYVTCGEMGCPNPRNPEQVSTIKFTLVIEPAVFGETVYPPEEHMDMCMNHTLNDILELERRRNEPPPIPERH